MCNPDRKGSSNKGRMEGVELWGGGVKRHKVDGSPPKGCTNPKSSTDIIGI